MTPRCSTASFLDLNATGKYYGTSVRIRHLARTYSGSSFILGVVICLLLPRCRRHTASLSYGEACRNVTP